MHTMFPLSGTAMYICIWLALLMVGLAKAATTSPGVIQCYSCRHASTLADCTTIERCDSSLEECYMDEVITEQLTIVYHGGCRAKDVCTRSAPGGIGRRRELVACSNCCGGEDRCNGNLCGITSGAPPSGTPTCYSCDHRHSDQSEVRRPEDCVTMTQCQSNEVCIVSTTITNGRPTYFFGCERKALCRVLMNATFTDLERCYGVDLTDPNLPDSVKVACGGTSSVVGRRQARRGTSVCHACCGDTACNYGSCQTVRDQMYAYYKNGVLDLNNLTTIKHV